MALFTGILSFFCFTVALAAAAHDREGNALRRALNNLRDSDRDLNDHVSLLQTGVQEMIVKAESRQSASEDITTVAEDACESFEKSYRSVDTSIDADDVQAAPVSSPKVIASPKEEAFPEEEPYGACTLKATLELMIVLLFVDGLRRWRLQRRERLGAEKLKVASVETPVAADDAWEEFVRAAYLGDEPGAQKALRNKAPVKRADTWGCTSLHFAAVGGSVKITGDLLQRGAEVDAIDACDESALHFAARAGHPDVCGVLLENGADANRLNAQDMTPLMVAGHANQEATCRFLADHGGHAGGMADEDLPALVTFQVLRKVLEAA